MNLPERPQDPRFTGDPAGALTRFHDSQYDYYGKRKKPDGRVLGDGVPVR